MHINDVYELLNRFENSSITELELEIEGVKLVLKKETECAVSAEQETMTVHSGAEIKKEQITKSESDYPQENIQADVVTQNIIEETFVEIKAQIAGTFYREPSPDSAPFVQVGQKVKKGDILGLMEAMKMFSNVTSPVDGEVVEILVEDESLAEYQQVLIRLKEIV